MSNQHSPRYFDGENKECSWCEDVKPLEEFHRDKRSVSGRAYYCKSCANHKSRKFHASKKSCSEYRKKKRNNYLSFTYGITLEDFDKLYNKQEGLCGICFMPLVYGSTYTHIDHCHLSGKIRGLLCTNCNRGLGHFQDNPKSLRRAANWIEENDA